VKTREQKVSFGQGTQALDLNALRFVGRAFFVDLFPGRTKIAPGAQGNEGYPMTDQ
jgi:hypothetical protein